MFRLVNFPLLIFVVSFFILWLAARAGIFLRKRRATEEHAPEDVGTVLAAILTLLGLLIGFTFSMAVSRYDQRKNYEAEEANAIGTEYVRAELLPEADAAKVRRLLKDYTDQRVLFYTTWSEIKLQEINARAAQLQTELWSSVKTGVKTIPPPMVGLMLQGMNDVINREGYTQAAWRNRIPVAAWTLMVTIAIISSVLIGYSLRRRDTLSFLILPLAVSISFVLIADIDSPRGGAIRVHPQNLQVLSESLHVQTP